MARLFRRGDAVVPIRIVAHERHAAPLVRVRDQAGGFALFLGQAAPNTPMSAAWSCPSTSLTAHPNARHLSTRGSSATVSSVLPPSCRPLRSTISVRLSEPPVRRGHRCFPVAPLLQLAIPCEHERAPGGPAQASSQRAAHGDRETVSQGAGVSSPLPASSCGRGARSSAIRAGRRSPARPAGRTPPSPAWHTAHPPSAPCLR